MTVGCYIREPLVGSGKKTHILYIYNVCFIYMHAWDHSDELLHGSENIQGKRMYTCVPGTAFV